jgi:VanZ family protein
MVIWKVIDCARQSGWVKAAAALCVLAICIGSLLPETERVPTGLPGKLEHFLAYSVTGLLLGLAMSGRKAPILAALNLALLACLLEFLQQWSPGRHPRVSDAVVGALAGMLEAQACRRKLQRNCRSAHLNAVGPVCQTHRSMNGRSTPEHGQSLATITHPRSTACRGGIIGTWRVPPE